MRREAVLSGLLLVLEGVRKRWLFLPNLLESFVAIVEVGSELVERGERSPAGFPASPKFAAE